MARKKKQTPEPPPENLDNTDDTFGLPEVEYQPLKRDEPMQVDEPAIPEEPNTSEPPQVVVINEVTAETPPPEETPPFQFNEEPIHEEPIHEKQRENIFEDQKRYDEDHQPYQPTYSYQRENAELWPKVLGFILVLLVAGLALWYFAYHRPEQAAKEERERKELQAIQEDARRKEDERLAAARLAEEESSRAAAAAVPATPAVGTIETLSGRSGRYYVVVASSIDGDLIMDYAKKLSAQGVSPKIIPPFGKSKFHRLAIAEGDTYATTQETANGLKGGDYGNKVWVVKY